MAAVPDKSRIWKSIFEIYGYSTQASIMELMPGSDPKILLGLEGYGYEGTYYGFDADRKALSALVETFTTSDPQNSVKIKTIEGLLQKIESPAVPVTYLVANHPLDDLMSYEFCRQNGFDYFRMRGDIAYSRRIWDSIQQYADRYISFAVHILKDSIGIIGPEEMVTISQYPSKFEITNGFHHETEICTAALSALGQDLVITGEWEDLSYKAAELFDSYPTMSAGHWITLKRT